MALHTLDELHSKTADYISDVINHGFKIDSNKSVSDNPHIFNVTLYNKITKQTVEISTKEDNDSFTRSYNIYCSLGGSAQRFNVPYYKVHDDIYADSKEEADREHKKWLAFNLGLGDIGDKDPIQAFTDMLANYINNCLHGDK